MDKHRLELFSDGVFAIILTLLVLDLKVPPHPEEIAGLFEVGPGLLVHAATFLLIGLIWTGHHNMMARMHQVSQRTLLLNLLALFWVSLMPFGARIAAEHPMASLGISLFTGCRAFYYLAFLGMRFSARTHIDEYPELRGFIRRRVWILIVMFVGGLSAAALSWVSPWIGYAWLLTAALGFLLRPAADVERDVLARRQEAEAAAATADA